MSTHCHILVAVLSIAAQTVSQQGNNRLEFELQEEQKAGTFVGDVAQRSGILTQVAAAEANKLTFEVLDTDGLRIPSLLTINHRTGSLYTSAMIDREQVCETGVELCRLEFDVSVKMDTALFKMLRVIVLVQDINDNPPTFPNKELLLTISESSPKGSDFSISAAIDRDSIQNAIITYWIEKNLFFGLQEERQLGVSVLKIVLLQELDREKQDKHYCYIYAKDGNSSSALTGSVSVTVTVTDVNDNSPEFLASSFNFTASEDAEVGSWVGTIGASDVDEGDNGRISFQFSSQTSNKIRQLFYLDAESGNVTARSSLLYEAGEVFQTVVVARDHGESPRVSYAVIVISVLDSGNKPPRMSLMLVAGPSYQSRTVLSEVLPVGSYVGRLKYQDNDAGDDGLVDCTSRHPNFELVSLEDESLAIQTKSLLDRETESEMVVILRCSDRGTPQMSTFMNFTVQVSDINDNSPVFERPGYTGNVTENQVSQPNIVQVSATDKDQGVNAEVIYRLAQNSSNHFIVDPFSGWISLAAFVDRESEPVFYLVIEAVDKGNPPLTGSVTVTILVEDVNDHAPLITRADYQVRENQEADTFLGQIVATDLDQGLNGRLVFQLVSDTTASFKVSRTGVLSSARTFDREFLDLYTVVVSVSDMGSPPLSSTSTLTITITDANDHSPVMIFPRPGNDTLEIIASSSPGTVLASALATDADFGRNSELVYLIAEGNPRQIFSIDNSTGAIFLVKRLTTSRDTDYRLTISVQDSGNPRLHNSSYLHIKVDFRNSTVDDLVSATGQKYVIIAGVLSGITVVIAVIVLAIILTLRRMDPARPPLSASKARNIILAGLEANETSEVKVQPMTTFKAVFTNTQTGNGNVLKDEGRNHGLPFCGDVTRGNAPSSHRSNLVSGDREHHTSPRLSSLLGDRPRLTSEDIHSDTSGEVSACDSGRGASDVEDTTCGALAHPGASPARTSELPQPAFRSPTLAPRKYNTQTKPSSVFPRDSTSLEDFTRGSTIQGARDKVRKMAGKVRFSCDDQTDHTSRPDKWQPGHGIHQDNRQPSGCQTARSYHNNLTQSRDSSHPSNGSSVLLNPGSSHTPQRPLSHARPVGHDQQHTDHTRTVSSFLLMPLSRGHPCGKQQHHQQQYPTHALLPSQPNSHQHHHHLVPLNVSVDDDDDDGSTTTSGSYVVEAADDTINFSVCS